MPESCFICLNPQSLQVDKEVILGKISFAQAARFLHVSLNDYMKHFREHSASRLDQMENTRQHQQEIKPPENLDDIQLLRWCTKQLTERLNEFLLLPIDATRDKTMLQVIQQVRGCIMDMAQLEGRLQTASFVQYNQLLVQYNTLNEVVLTSLCPKCREALERKLEVVIKKK